MAQRTSQVRLLLLSCDFSCDIQKASHTLVPRWPWCLAWRRSTCEGSAGLGAPQTLSLAVGSAHTGG